MSEHLWRLHELAQSAARARRQVIEAMAWAKRDGVTDEQIADVTGLSVDAVRAYLATRSRPQPDTVGRRPLRPRHRSDVARG